MILWSFLGFILILWLTKLQREHMRKQAERRDRQRRQSLGIAPIPGARGGEGDLDLEEQRLLALLRERESKSEGDG